LVWLGEWLRITVDDFMKDQRGGSIPSRSWRCLEGHQRFSWAK
jgi:hypothetical protein